jgi:hypothetical protein
VTLLLLLLCCCCCAWQSVAMQLPETDGALLGMLSVSLRPLDPSQHGATICVAGLAAFHNDNKREIIFRQWR